MFWQIEVAKLTLALRNFPDWMSVQDRELTGNQALRDAGLSRVEWDLATTQQYDGQGEPKLSKVSILHVPTYGARKKLMQASDRSQLGAGRKRSRSQAKAATHGQEETPQQILS